MKIFHLIESLGVGGSETQAVAVAQRLSKEGHQVSFGALRLGRLAEGLARVGIQPALFPCSGIDSPSGLREMLRLAWHLRSLRIDVLHTHDLYSNLLGVPAGRLAGVPMVVSSRRDLGHWAWYNARNRRVLGIVLNWSKRVVVNSEAIREVVTAKEHVRPDKIRVVYNGIDASKFIAAVPSESLRARYGADARFVAMVGNMHIPVKGHGFVIEAARKVCSACPAAHFVFVGDGVLRDELEQHTASAGLSENVHFLGDRSDVPAILAAAEIGLLASTAEGLPNAVLEYMAAGLPVVATAVGGVPELIADGANGVLIPASQPDEIANAVLGLLGDPLRARALGTAARQTVVERFTLESTARNLASVYAGA